MNFFDLAFFADVSRMDKGEFFASDIKPTGTKVQTPQREAPKPIVNPIKQAIIFKNSLKDGTYATKTDVAVATLNALSGNEIPERRTVLLGQLAVHFGDEELSMLLPDKSKKLEAFMRLARVELDTPKVRDADGAVPEDSANAAPVVISFKLEQSDTQPVELALGLLSDSENCRIPPGQALGKLARFFLDSHRPEIRTAKRRKVARA